jgi:hypothetical protein
VALGGAGSDGISPPLYLDLVLSPLIAFATTALAAIVDNVADPMLVLAHLFYGGRGPLAVSLAVHKALTSVSFPHRRCHAPRFQFGFGLCLRFLSSFQARSLSGYAPLSLLHKMLLAPLDSIGCGLGCGLGRGFGLLANSGSRWTKPREVNQVSSTSSRVVA